MLHRRDEKSSNTRSFARIVNVPMAMTTIGNVPMGGFETFGGDKLLVALDELNRRVSRKTSVRALSR